MMIDRKKVIKGIECSLNHHTEICEECPYYDLFKQEKHCGRQLKLDTLALLKEQQEEIEERTNEAAAYAELLIKYGYKFT